MLAGTLKRTSARRFEPDLDITFRFESLPLLLDELP
jgi:hypothetical protein